ncbi:moaE protein domain-containing protein [Phthorimaea operculella]|nr:moaE protein domain-containing protein [Phthorimaea operculella]
MDHLKLTVDALSVDAISDLVMDDTCGAVSIFVGTTRDNFEGKKVVRLEYEAYEPMALKAMKSICDEVRRQFPAVHGIAIYHRLGNVPCREASVVIAVSSPHRRDSLDAVASCIEQLKASVPIWKKEVYDAAAPVWKENAECAWSSNNANGKARPSTTNPYYFVKWDSLDAVASCIEQLKASVPIWKKEVYDAAAPVWKENAECAWSSNNAKGKARPISYWTPWTPSPPASSSSKPASPSGRKRCTTQPRLFGRRTLNSTTNPYHFVNWDSLYAVASCIEQLKASVPIWKKEVYDAAAPSTTNPYHFVNWDSLYAVASCIEQLKASVPIWKKEVYDAAAPVWKENAECPRPQAQQIIDKNLVQLTVSAEELEQRIQNFIQRKRDQVNLSNVHDFTPGRREDEEETCARVRAQFQRRADSKGHLKIRKVNNEWGPQTVEFSAPAPADQGLPAAIAERVIAVEKFLNMGPVAPDIYQRLKAMEERIAALQAVSPEYAQFWRNKNPVEESEDTTATYQFSAEDIARKIEQLEREGVAS